MKVWILKKRFNSLELLKKIYENETGQNFEIAKLNYNKYGKPFYDDKLKFDFNISHSKNYTCIVFSKSNVGIDIEEKRKLYKNFDRSFIAENELIINGNILNNWVIKEAYSKFLGIGLYLDFKKISVKEICLNNNVYNLSKENFICYVVGFEKIESIKYELS